MKLYLSSYKLGDKEGEIKKWIDVNGNKIALIPNSRDIYEDGERKMSGINKDSEQLKEIGFDVSIISLKDYFGKYDKLVEDLKDYKAFYVIGGNSFVLRKAMQLSGFDTFLKNIKNKEDYLYVGYSAGICVLAPNMDGLQLVDEPVNPYNDDDVIYDGISLIDYLPLPHYKSNHPETELIDKSVKYCNDKNIKYKTLSDGDVIIENI